MKNFEELIKLDELIWMLENNIKKEEESNEG